MLKPNSFIKLHFLERTKKKFWIWFLSSIGKKPYVDISFLTTEMDPLLHLCGKMTHWWIPSIYKSFGNPHWGHKYPDQPTFLIPCIASCFKVQSPKSDLPTTKKNKNYINPKIKSPQSIDEREKEGSPSFKRSHRELFKSIDLSHLAWFN